MSELKPCQKCGSDDIHLSWIAAVPTVVCDQCDHKEPERSWNTRHITLDTIPEVVKREIEVKVLEDVLLCMAQPEKDASPYSSGYRLARKHVQQRLSKIRKPSCWTPDRGDKCDCPACGGFND